MTADLAAVLDRAAAFLRALPEGTPTPSFRQFADVIVLDFIKRRLHYVSVHISSSGHLHYLTVEGTNEGFGWCDFDGGPVPPAIIAAIGRVTS